MNKAQKQVLQAQLKAEQQTLKKLQGIYKTALDDIDKNIGALLARTDTENLQSIIYQVEYQKALRKQIEDVLSTMQIGQFDTISEYLTECYEYGYAGVMYDLHKQGIPIITPINQKQVVAALKTDSKLSKNLYDSVGESVTKLKHNIQRNLSRGIAQGQSYADITRNIAREMVGDYSKFKGGALYVASRITRTEGHRIQNQAAMDAQHAAKEKGANIVKQWDATLDKRTRPAHARADGQIREIDEDFDVWDEKLKAPGIGGSARNVINCRCACLQRARWALDEDELKTLQERAKYFGLDKTDDFEDFKQKYFVASQATKEPPKGGIIEPPKGGIIEKLERLKACGMPESDYEEYLRLLNDHENGDIRRLYATYADGINGVRYSPNGGVYRPSLNSLEFGYPDQRYISDGMHKYSTLAHEYGHYFDAQATFDGLHYSEMEALSSNLTYMGSRFKNLPSSSDEFLAAVRADKAHLSGILTSEARADLAAHNASAGVQDAVDGLFANSRIRWGHGEKYYNRKYSSVKSMGEQKEMQAVYKSLGLDASNQTKVQLICRQYEAASEMWANIMSAIVCGGEELEYVKKYLPNSYQAILTILKGVV